jgi:hypothetical protein
VQNPEGSQNSETFSDLRNSTFKHPYRPCELPLFFLHVAVQICECLVIKVTALLIACRGIYKLNLANLKKVQNPEDLRILGFFGFLKFHF